MTRADAIIYLDLILPQMAKDGWDVEYREALALAIEAFKAASDDTVRVNANAQRLLCAKGKVFDAQRHYERTMTGLAADALREAWHHYNTEVGT